MVRPMVKLYVIAGSSRPGRFNIQPATWIYELAKKRTDFETELLDLAEVNLPFLDEPASPAQRKYTHEHTRRWSSTIDAGDGFILVTPEYNHSFSPVLKNALDYLFQEWNYKPVSFVSYGSLAGGSRAVEHLRGVAAELKMFDLREQILLPNYWEHLDAQGKYQFTERHVASANGMFDTLAFWAAKMKDARKELAQQQKK
jgi:NAD(P)H-dependent FMN reductase